MPVQINYKGRFGNELCQYIAARIFAEKNKLNLLTSLQTPDIIPTTPHKYFEEDNHDYPKKIMSFLNFDKNDELIYYALLYHSLRRHNYLYPCRVIHYPLYIKNLLKQVQIHPSRSHL